MNPSRPKKRRSIEAQCDVISDLPRDVLHKIMERLPIRDAARMSLLSHKWHLIWTTIPFLSFDLSFFSSLNKQLSESHVYSNIVSKILLQHEGPILRFSIYLPRSYSCPEIAPWISYVSSHGLKDFSLCNETFKNLHLSSRLFSCGGMEMLKFSRCAFKPLPSFRGFPKLISLELCYVSLSYSTFKILMGNCPVLQKFVMTTCIGLDQMDVVIDSPKLRVLVLDWRFKSLELKSCENLVSASIGLLSSNVHNKAGICGLLKVLTKSSKLERLCLRGFSYKVFLKELSLHNTLVKLKFLEFQCLLLDNNDTFSSLISCVQSFTNIDTLKISIITGAQLNEHVLDFNPDCTLHTLRFAIVGISRCSIPELKLVEFLLACSPVLEKLSVVPTALVGQGDFTRMAVQLNRFRRVSPKVEVICPEPRIPVTNVSVPPASSSPSETNSSESSLSGYSSSNSDSSS